MQAKNPKDKQSVNTHRDSRQQKNALVLTSTGLTAEVNSNTRSGNMNFRYSYCAIDNTIRFSGVLKLLKLEKIASSISLT